MLSLLDQIQISRVSNAVAAGTSDVKGTHVDMKADGGWDGVVFLAVFGTLTSTQVTFLKAQHSDTTTDGDFADLAGSATAPLADGDSNKMLAIDIQQPSKSYVRPVVDRGTANAVLDGIFAIRYRGRSVPQTQAAIAALKQLVAPASGTA